MFPWNLAGGSRPPAIQNSALSAVAAGWPTAHLEAMERNGCWALGTAFTLSPEGSLPSGRQIKPRAEPLRGDSQPL